MTIKRIRKRTQKIHVLLLKCDNVQNTKTSSISLEQFFFFLIKEDMDPLNATPQEFAIEQYKLNG